MALQRDETLGQREKLFTSMMVYVLNVMTDEHLIMSVGKGTIGLCISRQALTTAVDFQQND